MLEESSPLPLHPPPPEKSIQPLVSGSVAAPVAAVIVLGLGGINIENLIYLSWNRH